MRKTFASFAALVLASSFASAAVIDDFSTPVAGQTVTQTTVGSSAPSNSAAPVANVIGGNRQVIVSISAITGGGGVGSASAKINVPTAGAAELNSDSNTNASEQFSYGTLGDLNANLSNGGLSNGFVIRLLETDLPSATNANSISVTTTGGGSGTANFTIPGLVGQIGGLVPPIDVVVPFSSFSGSPNFADIDTIGLNINGPASSDYTLDFFATNTVPEPASLSLFGIGAMGLLARRKRA